MSLLAALLLAAHPAPTAAPPAEQPMIDAFKAACANPEDFDGMKAAAAGSGWEEIAEDAEPRLAALIRMGREAAAEEEPGGKALGANYRRAYLGRHIYLIVSRHEAAEGYWGNGCRVYDFDAAAALDKGALDRLVGKPATGEQDLGGGLVKWLWEPGFQDGMTIEATFVPRDHSIGKTFGLEGNILVAQAIGGFESLFAPPAEDEPEAAAPPANGNKE